MKTAILQEQRQQTDQQPTRGRHGDRQDRVPSTAGRPEQRVVHREHSLDETDSHHGDDAADDEAERGKYGNALEQSASLALMILIMPTAPAFVPVVLRATRLPL
jgi:hypothetical protein